MHAVVADPVGGPENLQYMELPTPQPGEGEVLVKLEASGVNYIDVYFRTGFYKAPETPVKLGNEGAGTIAAVGKGTILRTGQRVAYAMARGSYAEYAVVPERMLAPLPDSVSFEDAAAVMLQGMTAHYLTRSTFALKPGHTCLIHASAGGAGLMIVQMAKVAGATVIGTCSTPEKAKIATESGADHTILYTQQDFVSEVKRITSNAGVDVVYDSVGHSTFHKSLDCLRARGMMVSFGQSSGGVGEIA
jgi:NADPH:quinone reductase